MLGGIPNHPLQSGAYALRRPLGRELLADRHLPGPDVVLELEPRCLAKHRQQGRHVVVVAPDKDVALDDWGLEQRGNRAVAGGMLELQDRAGTGPTGADTPRATFVTFSEASLEAGPWLPAVGALVEHGGAGTTLRRPAYLGPRPRLVHASRG